MTNGEILFAILTGLAINECCEISPWAARKLIRWSAHHRYVDPARAEIRAEELAALVDARPGKLLKLITALGFVTGTCAIALRRAIARRMHRVVQLVKRVTPGVRAPLTPLLTTTPVVLMDTSSHGARACDLLRGNSFVNNLERDWVLAACRRVDRELRSSGRSATVTVLTYYSAQAHALRRLLVAHQTDFPAIRFQVIGTLDEAQGHDSDFAIVSFCRAARSTRSKLAGFLSDLRRFHVVMTRARHGLILVGHAQTLRRVIPPINQVLDNAVVLHDLWEFEA
jgi:hypothetical protein